jgi:hypothetical protein
MGYPGLYKWVYAYDDFIGYLAGILSIESVRQGIGGACVI